MSNKFAIRMLAVVVAREKGDDVVSFLRKQGVNFNIVVLAYGTAPTKWSDFLGLGETKKDIVFSVISAEQSTAILESLAENFHFREAGKGVAFTFDIDSVGGKRVLNYCTNLSEEEKE